jgi:hypothetical protein
MYCSQLDGAGLGLFLHASVTDGHTRESDQISHQVTAQTFGAWWALSGSNSSGFVLQTRSASQDQFTCTNSIKIKSPISTIEQVLLVDIGLEFCEPALQVLNGVHFPAKEEHKLTVNDLDYHPQQKKNIIMWWMRRSALQRKEKRKR